MTGITEIIVSDRFYFLLINNRFDPGKLSLWLLWTLVILSTQPGQIGGSVEIGKGLGHGDGLQLRGWELAQERTRSLVALKGGELGEAARGKDGGDSGVAVGLLRGNYLIRCLILLP